MANGKNKPGRVIRDLTILSGFLISFVLLFSCLVLALLAQSWVESLGSPTVVGTDSEIVVEAEPEPVNRLVFVDPSGQVGTVAPDGSDSRQLTDDPERLYLFPAWSPDSSAIAAIGSDSDGGGVFGLQDVGVGEGSMTVALHQDEDVLPFYLYWSPDSRQISFLANNPAGIGLHLVDSNGESDSELLTTGQPFYWQWTNDTNQLFVHTGASGDEATLGFIDTVNAEGDGNLSRPGHFQAPGLSADEQYLAYAELDSDGTRYVVIENRETGERHQTEHAGYAALNWSPTRPQLAFTSPPMSAPFDGVSFGTLHLMDAETGNVRILSDEVVIAFFWSPDGENIAFLTLNEGDEDITASRPVHSSKHTQQDQEDNFTLNLWIVNIESGLANRLLAFEPTNLFVTQFLPFFDQYNLSHSIWSPKSDALVLPIASEDGPQVTVVPLNGETPTVVADGFIAFWSHR